jgi:hypothetical protein
MTTIHSPDARSGRAVRLFHDFDGVARAARIVAAVNVASRFSN